MCLVAVAIDQHRRFPLVVAANRDEFWNRPTQRLGWWSPGAGLPDILGGRDLQAGGTWLGLNAAGRLALVTNIREPDRHEPLAPSRGSIVPLWLRDDLPIDKFWMRVALEGHNGFNLIAADFAAGECFWAANRGVLPKRLERGLWGLSNAALDTPWPKVEALKQRLRDTLEHAPDVDSAARSLFEALADRTIVADADLPSTGIPLGWERALSPAFIRTDDGRYGTRSSTLVICERTDQRQVTHVFERSFSPDSSLALLRRMTLADWPPRHASTPPAAQADVVDDATLAAAAAAPASGRRRAPVAAALPRRSAA